MKILILAVLAVVAGQLIARADEFKIEKVGDIEALPCSIFIGEGVVSLREGVTLSIPLSKTNNKDVFDSLGARSARCRNGGASEVMSDASGQ